jgi:hypothetical protein
MRLALLPLLLLLQDLQNLSMKFRSKHTSALQHAMYWWPKAPLIPAAAAAATEADVASSSSSSSPAESQTQDDSGSTTVAASTSSSSSSSSPAADLAETAARLSFAALQHVPEASPKVRSYSSSSNSSSSACSIRATATYTNVLARVDPNSCRLNQGDC